MSNATQPNPCILSLSLLPTEIQILIYQHTFPPPRVLEATLFEYPYSNPEFHEGSKDVANFRLGGLLSTMLDLDDSVTRPLMGPPFDPFNIAIPVALHICQLARFVALESYRVMPSLGGDFYYAPAKDVVVLDWEIMNDYPYFAPHLQRFHGEELGRIDNVMVSDSQWCQMDREISYARKFLGCFGGLKTVMVAWRKEDEGWEVEEGEEEHVYLDDGEGGDEEARELRCAIRFARNTFKGVVRLGNCTATRLEILDRKGVVYT